jgi:hypothetical protein
MEGVGVGAGVDLADLGADARGGLHLGDIGVDEDADDDARVGQARHRVLQLRLLGHDVEAAFGGHLVAAFGHEHRHLGLDLAGDADHLVGGGHLEVELDLGEVAQLAHVGVLDVAAVFAQVHGDAVGPPRWASTAAHTGSGSQVRRAWRRVATWSMLTPSSIKTDLRERQTVR